MIEKCQVLAFKSGRIIAELPLKFIKGRLFKEMMEPIPIDIILKEKKDGSI